MPASSEPTSDLCHGSVSLPQLSYQAQKENDVEREFILVFLLSVSKDLGFFYCSHIVLYTKR